jgi:peptidoglycan/xylan/chitin deacetylase (PgdA/CDA1 family)
MTPFSALLTTRILVRRAVIRCGLEAIALARPVLPDLSGRGAIFTLHHVRPQRPESFHPNALLEVTPEFLSTALATIKAAGLTPIHVDELPDRLADKSDTRKFAAFTLDDGCQDNFIYALPVFRKHNVPFSVFAAAGFVERTRSMWWLTAEELVRKLDVVPFDFGGGVERLPAGDLMDKFEAFRRLTHYVATVDEDKAVAVIDETARRHGIDPLAIVARETMDLTTLRAIAADPLARIEAHTLTHPALARLSAERLMQEITGSADKVEEYVGRRPRALAYPYGTPASVGPREFEAARKAGFAVAMTTQPGMLGPDSMSAPTALTRVSLNGHYQQARYVSALLTGVPFLARPKTRHAA